MRPAAASLLAAATLFAASLAAQPPAQGGAQWTWPSRMANPQVLSAETPPERLRELMTRFTASLGVRCSYCHSGTEGEPLATFDFASDANPRKAIARSMMRMSYRLNTQDLPAIEGLTSPRIGCYSCHRGSPIPVADPPAAPPRPQ